MPCYVYILYSPSLDLHYTGFSKYHWKRQRQHRQKHRRWTGRAQDWVEVFCVKAATSREARALERKIKGRGAKRFLGEHTCRTPAVLDP